MQASKSGWLEKRGAIITSYKRRWCVLREGRLWYYEKEDSTAKERGFISLIDCRVSTDGDTARTFHIHTSDRVWHLRCASERDVPLWAQAIAEASRPVLLGRAPSIATSSNGGGAQATHSVAPGSGAASDGSPRAPRTQSMTSLSAASEAKLANGCLVTVWPASSGPQSAFACVVARGSQVVWWTGRTSKPPRSLKPDTQLLVREIETVVVGKQPVAAARQGLSELTFCQVVSGAASFFVQFADAETCAIWHGALSSLAAFARRDPFLDYMRLAWYETDVDGSDTLSLDEIRKMAKRINLGVTSRELKFQFALSDVDRSGELDFAEFVSMMRQLRRQPEVDELFARYAGGKSAMSAADVARFLVDQGDADGVEAATADAERVIVRYERAASAKALTLFGFTDYLSSADVDVMDPVHRGTVYQDMTRPLADYYMNSSHNTYLEADQLKGKSSVDAYVRALRLGCRCVEIDCWDGDDGDPIVYHGHTLTSKIRFRDVIRAIRDHGFAATPYPVVLSLEVHCSVAQQTTMAEIMREIIGEMLMPSPIGAGMHELPSPEDLRNRILLKGKAIMPPAAALTRAMSRTASKAGAASATGGVADDDGGDGDDDDDNDEDDDGNEDEGAAGDAASGGGKKRKPAKVTVSAELSSITYLPTKTFKTLADRSAPAYLMSSFSERKVTSLCKKDLDAFIDYNTAYLTRVYPMGVRVDSSNYDPTPAWEAGCQIVALNYQTSTLPMWLNLGKFSDNGGCGYVLKPARMLAPTQGAAWSPPVRVRVRLARGRHLPKPKLSRKGEIVDPYVTIEVNGAHETAKFKTNHVDDNGFNPAWNTTVDLDVEHPDTALLSFVVWDKDFGPDDLLAYRVVPVRSLRTGWRSVELWGADHAPVPLCSLFVHIDVAPK